jgi:beta-galactosidase
MYKFPFKNMSGFNGDIANKDIYGLVPNLCYGSFVLTETGDTFLDMHGFGKGFVFVNGHNLGKYWNIGPQQTLYLPGCWLKKGLNTIVVFDELKINHKSIGAIDHPVLDEVAKN